MRGGKAPIWFSEPELQFSNVIIFNFEKRSWDSQMGKIPKNLQILEIIQVRFLSSVVIFPKFFSEFIISVGIFSFEEKFRDGYVNNRTISGGMSIFRTSYTISNSYYYFVQITNIFRIWLSNSDVISFQGIYGLEW